MFNPKEAFAQVVGKFFPEKEIDLSILKLQHDLMDIDNIVETEVMVALKKRYKGINVDKLNERSKKHLQKMKDDLILKYQNEFNYKLGQLKILKQQYASAHPN